MDRAQAHQKLARWLDRKKSPPLPIPLSTTGLSRKGRWPLDGSPSFSQVTAPGWTSFLLHQHRSHEFGFRCGREPNLRVRLQGAGTIYVPTRVRISSAPHLTDTWYFRVVNFSLLGKFVMIFLGDFICIFLMTNEVRTFSHIYWPFILHLYEECVEILCWFFLCVIYLFLIDLKESFMYSGH